MDADGLKLLDKEDLRDAISVRMMKESGPSNLFIRS